MYVCIYICRNIDTNVYIHKYWRQFPIIHARLSQIIRAVFVLHLELFITNPGLFCAKETGSSRIVHCQILWNYSGCYCLWLGIVHDNSRPLFVPNRPAVLELFIPDSVESFRLLLFMTWNCSWQLQVSFCAKEICSFRVVHFQILWNYSGCYCSWRGIVNTTPGVFCAKETCNDPLTLELFISVELFCYKLIVFLFLFIRVLLKSAFPADLYVSMRHELSYHCPPWPENLFCPKTDFIYKSTRTPAVSHGAVSRSVVRNMYTYISKYSLTHLYTRFDWYRHVINTYEEYKEKNHIHMTKNTYRSTEEKFMRPGHHWLFKFGEVGDGTSCEKKFNLTCRSWDSAEDYKGTQFYNGQQAGPHTMHALAL